MRIEFDPAKSRKNEEERGLPFTKVAEFDFGRAVTVRDERRDYPEPRFVAKGFIGTRLFVLCYNTCSRRNPRHFVPQGQCPRGEAP